MGRFTRKIGRKRIQAGKQGREAVPSEDLSKLIDELKSLVVSSRDIQVPVGFFHDHVSNVDGFMSMSAQTSDEIVTKVVVTGVRRVIPDFEIQLPLTFQLADQHLWHGALHGSRGEFAAFFYFDDIHVGAMHLVPDMATPRNHFLRFSGVPITAPIIPGSVTRGQA